MEAADPASRQVVGQASQKLQAINPQTYLGPGKLAELVQLAKSAGAETIIFVRPSMLCLTCSGSGSQGKPCNELMAFCEARLDI